MQSVGAQVSEQCSSLLGMSAAGVVVETCLSLKYDFLEKCPVPQTVSCQAEP